VVDLLMIHPTQFGEDEVVIRKVSAPKGNPDVRSEAARGARPHEKTNVGARPHRHADCWPIFFVLGMVQHERVTGISSVAERDIQNRSDDALYRSLSKILQAVRRAPFLPIRRHR
jgi:hypothetical protein